MKITVDMPGLMGRSLDFPEGATVRDLLHGLGMEEGDVVTVRTHKGERFFPDRALADGDRLLVVHPVSGGAPLPPGGLPEGLALVKAFADGAAELIIVDPYILKPRKGVEDSDYAALLADCTGLQSGTLKRLRLIYSAWHHKQPVLDEMVRRCASHGCNLACHDTEEIHDRIWIKDRRQGLVVGTSLNSVGGRLAFALKLPESDLAFLNDFLLDRRMIPPVEESPPRSG